MKTTVHCVLLSATNFLHVTGTVNMSAHSPAPRHSYLRIAFFLLFVAAVVAGAGFLTAWSSDDAIGVTEDKETPAITIGEAARIRALDEEAKSDSAITTTTRGEVIDISQHSLVVESGGQRSVWPLAADIQIWKNREAITHSDVMPGDIVKADLRQSGSRSDGWMNTAVKIDVASDDIPDTTDSSQLDMPTTEVDGIVVETRPGVIVVENLSGMESAYPLKRTALVLDGAEAIPLEDLAAGDKVTLTTSQSGSCSDGWVVTVDRIERRP